MFLLYSDFITVIFGHPAFVSIFGIFDPNTLFIEYDDESKSSACGCHVSSFTLGMTSVDLVPELTICIFKFGYSNRGKPP